MSSQMYCTACRTAIGTDEERMEHYRLEWHRFNVKRRCTELPPIDRETFESKLLALQQQQADEARTYRCDVCNKDFPHEGTYQQHMTSKKHLKRAAYKQPDTATVVLPADDDNNNEDQDQEEEEEEEVKQPADEDEELDFSKAIPLKTCLFCGQVHKQLQACLDHMLKQHGFFIPFVEYLHDMEGLLEYLGAKVGVGHVCLYCNGRGRAAFPSLQAVRQHMSSKSHCKIRFEEDEEDDEFLDYYTFPDDDVDMAATDADPADKRRVETMNELGELVLSDGTLLGHRDMRKYYKQSLVPETNASRLAKQMLAEYKMIGLPGYNNKEKVQHWEKAKKLKRRHDQAWLKLGMKNNNMAHFKDATGAF